MLVLLSLRLLLLLWWPRPAAEADELISVRCQAACLHQLQLGRGKYLIFLQTNPEMRRSLKKQIVSSCKDDANCTACTMPCSESFTTLDACRSRFCTDGSPSRAACESSCGFVQAIYTEKPGSCPATRAETPMNECAASCHLDGDCGETQKCCEAGCSRRCLAPVPPSARRLLPLPSRISIQERKRRRSAVVRWELRRLTAAQAHSLSNLFVLQWRWGVREDALIEWQTILIRNKPYAILKHLLSPGRFYQFRVAAVNEEGSLGFSTPSRLFRLSKVARTPSAPRMSLGVSRLSPDGLWSQTIQWTPPHSDLPIKGYELSWWESAVAEVNASSSLVRHSQGRRAQKSAMNLSKTQEEEEEDEEEEEETGASTGSSSEGQLERAEEEPLRHSTILPSHHTSRDLDGLAPDTLYVVELSASVESADGELQGEKGFVVVRTASLNPPSPSPLPEHHSNFPPTSAPSSSSPLHSPPPPTLSCRVESLVVKCTWPPPPTTTHSSSLDSTIGYRVVLSSPALGLHETSMIPPLSPHATFQNLPYSSEFRVEIQPVTSRGVGSLLTTTFSTLPVSVDEEEAEVIHPMHPIHPAKVIELLSSCAFSSVFLAFRLLQVFCAFYLCR